MQMAKTRRSGGRDGGAALLTALFVLLLLQCVGMAFLRSVYAGVALARHRVREAKVRHYAEGALEALAARGSPVSGLHTVTIDEGTIRVAVVSAESGYRLTVEGVAVRGDGESWEAEEAGVEGMLRPVGGRWRLETRFR